MQELQPGQVIDGLRGRYQVERRCGEGGFGLTFRGTDALGRPVALKQLRFERLRDWKALELFEREGRALERLHHPSIPAYIDFFAHDGQRPCPPAEAASRPGQVSWVLVQQFVEGATLQQAIEHGPPLPAEQLTSILTQMLEVLVYLHGQSPPVVHRDINPKNIVLAPDGRAYLVDFGAIQDQLRAADTHGSTTVGTLGYMPLEQLRGAARPASDLYALGMTMLVAAARRPASGLPVDDASGKVQVEAVAPQLLPAARRVLDGMVEPLVGPRLGTATEALRRLRAPGPGPTAPQLAPLAPSGGASHAPVMVAIGAAAALLLAGVGAAVMLLRVRSPGPPPPIAVTATAPRTPPPTPVRPSPTPTVAPVAAKATRPYALRWPAQLVSASGVAVKGACAIDATGEATDEDFQKPQVKVLCGTDVLYDSTVPLNGTSMSSWGIEEKPASKAGQFIYDLGYSDVGTRTGPRAQATLDTQAGQVVVFHDTVPIYRVVLRAKGITLAGEPFVAAHRASPAGSAPGR